MKLLVKQFFIALFIPFCALLVIGTFYNINTAYELSKMSTVLYGKYNALHDRQAVDNAIQGKIWDCFGLLLQNRAIPEKEWNDVFSKVVAAPDSDPMLKAQVLEIRTLLTNLYNMHSDRSDGVNEHLAVGIETLNDAIHNFGADPNQSDNMQKHMQGLAHKSHNLGNTLLYATICFLVVLAIVYVFLTYFIATPLRKFSFYIKSLGQVQGAAALPDLPKSRIQEIDEISASLSNLGKYLDIATQKSIKIEKKATIDGLTQLFNRRTFDEKLVSLWETAKTNDTDISLIMLDVDKFKVYNDCCGHQAGDECLKVVSSSLAKAVRNNVDFCARYGGEEFVVILPNTGAQIALKVANRIHMTLANKRLEHPNSPTGKYVTVSLGLASLHPATVDVKPTKLVSCADEALYFTKENGRNGTTIYAETFERVPAPKVNE